MQVDTLSIPLDDYIKKTRTQSRFNAVHALGITACIAFPLILNGIMRQPMQWLTAFIIPGPAYLILAAGALNNIKAARKRLRALASKAPANVTLDANGMEFPKALLEQYPFDDALQSGGITIKLRWKDISNWYIFNAGRYVRAHYNLTVASDRDNPLATYYNIQRIFSKKDEKTLLDFAQSHLTSPILQQGSFIRMYARKIT